jgi:hypothetical protein
VKGENVMNNQNQGCGCCNQGCPPLEPIVMPTKVCNIVKCHPIEQPVICPSHTHVIHRYVPFNRYYYQHTNDEETQCPGSQAQTGNMGMNNNNFGM